MKTFNKIIFLIFIFTSFVYSKDDLKAATLRLSWFDQFQFAGYYIAKEKGFYKEAGLDVEILPFEFGIEIAKDVQEKKVDFAVGRENLILEKNKYKNLVALMALFQASPLEVIAKKSSNINSILEFENKKIMSTIDDSNEISFKAMLASKKIDFNKIDFIPHSHNIYDLIEDKTDLITAYSSKAPYWLNKEKIDYISFAPRDYGFDMYSDFLYTNSDLIKEDLNKVQAFKNASIKAWEWAFANIEESAKIIFEKYNNQNLELDELIFEGKQLKKLAFINGIKLGNINYEKLKRVYDLYNVMGFVDEKIDIDEFIFSDISSFESSLTRSEKEYLKDKNFINMCVIPEAMPLSQIKDEKYIGISADLIKVLERTINKPMKLVSTKYWSDSLEFVENKSCEILSSAVKTESRDRFLNFTDSLISMPLVLITKNKISFIDDIASLESKKISIVTSYALNEILKDRYKNIDFVNVANIDDGFEKVIKDENFGHIDFLPVAWYKIQKKYNYKLSISSKLDEKVDLRVAVNKDEKILFNILNKAVSLIDEQEKDLILDKWLLTSYDEEFDFKIIYYIIIVSGGVFFIILIRQRFLNNLNRRLRHIIDLKTKQLRNINRNLEKRVEKELEENFKKDRLLAQQQKMISMGQMIENIAHQWRQPLSVITTSASAVKLKKELNILDDAYLINSLDSIVNTAQYLSQTIDDFRYFYKPQKEKEIFYLDETFRKTSELLKENLIENRINLKIIATKIQVFGYESEFIQVLINILNNSKDAFHNMDIENKYIFLELEKYGKKVKIKIYDNAGGIKEEILEKIFEPYFTTKHQSQGTGIGLYMCQEIIAKHLNGTIEIENYTFIYNNEKHKGAKTTIILDIKD